MTESGQYLLLDIGGTSIKGLAVDAAQYRAVHRERSREKLAALFDKVTRIPSGADDISGRAFRSALKSLAEQCGGSSAYRSVAISTAGVVAPCGTRIVKCSAHLAFLGDGTWAEELQQTLGCPVTLINDGEAFILGAADLGYVPQLGTVSAMILGTGLGFGVVRDGRWWRPRHITPLFGNIRIPGGTYDHWVSASRLAEQDPDGDLLRCLQSPGLAQAREAYWQSLSDVAVTSGVIFGVDKLLLGGGLCDAAARASIDIGAEIQRRFTDLPPELDHWPALEVVKEGNRAQLIGAAALADGNVAPEITVPFTPGVLSDNESPDSLAEVTRHIRQQWPLGGRIIFVGAGYEGRLAAAASLESTHRFGIARDRVIALVAGGLCEAALDIEPSGEQDSSAASDMILLRPGQGDTVVGIFTGGETRFVRTALAFALRQGAATVMLETAGSKNTDCNDWTITLRGDNTLRTDELLLATIHQLASALVAY